MRVLLHSVRACFFFACCVLLPASVMAQTGTGGVLPASNSNTSGIAYHNYGYAFQQTNPTQPGSVTCAVAFTDGYTSQVGYTWTGNLADQGVVSGGQQYNSPTLNFEPGTTDSFPSTQVTPTLRCFDNNNSPISYNGPPFENHTEGITIAAVFSVDSAGAFHPLQGATIHFSISNGSTQFEQSYAPPLRSLGGSQSVYCCFGQQQGALVQPDKSYPDGMARDTYHFYATCPGYTTIDSTNNVVGADGHDPTGYEWVGRGCALIMQPSGSSTPGKAIGGANLDSGTGPLSSSSSSGGAACAAVDYTDPPSDAGGGNGIPNWSDNSFPATVQPAYLHTSSWTETVSVASAGSYVITGDCPTAPNIGIITLSVAGVAGSPVNCTSSSPGAAIGASFGTFQLAAGANTLTFALSGSYGAVKVLHLNPTSTCGASSGSGSTSNDDSLLGFVSNFWTKIQTFFQSLFTLDPADLQSIKSAASNLANYGPLGVPAGVIAEFQNDFGSVYTGIQGDGTQPGYWAIPLQSLDFDNATASLHAAPQGYVGGYQAPAPPPNIYMSMFPSQLDLTPYANHILLGRRLALIFFWLVVLFGLIYRFTPEVRL